MEEVQQHPQEDQEIQKLAKQRYLVREILEKGYDPQEFSCFLDSKKENGKIIDSWSIDELQELVLIFQDNQLAIQLQMIEQNEQQEAEEEYKQIQTKGKQREQVTRDKEETKGSDKLEQEENCLGDDDEWETTDTNQSNQLYPFLKEENLPNLVQVFQCQPTILNKHRKKISIDIGKVKTVQTTGFFLIKYYHLEFNIESQPFNWAVQRVEQDFYSIRKLLLLNFPHLIVPPLPLKMETKFSQKSIDKRQKIFQRFLRAVVKSELFCTYPYLVEFLKINHKNQKQFSDELKAEEIKLMKKRNLEQPKMTDLCSMEEFMQTILQPTSVGFDTLNFGEKYENYYDRLFTELGLMRDQSFQLSAKYQQLQQCLVKISQLYSKSDSLLELEVWANMSKVFGSDSYYIEQQADILTESLNYLRYNAEYVNAFNEFQTKQDYTRKKFFKAEKEFLRKKDKVASQIGQQNQELIQSQHINSLLQVEQHQIDQNRQLANVFTNNMLNEIQRIQEEVEKQDMIEMFCRRLPQIMTVELNSRHVIWSELDRELEKVNFPPE